MSQVFLRMFNGKRRKRRPDNQNVLRGEEGDGLGQASSPGAAMFWVSIIPYTCMKEKLIFFFYIFELFYFNK